MSVSELVNRAKLFIDKYEKYDFEARKKKPERKGDAWGTLYDSVESEVEALVNKAEDAQLENNKAAVATLNAEIRRGKAALKSKLSELEKLVTKKLRTVTPEQMEERKKKTLSIMAKVDAVADGSKANRLKFSKKSKNHIDIKFDTKDVNFKSNTLESSEDSRAFRQEYEKRRDEQDGTLDLISGGLHTLKNNAMDIQEELNKQSVLTDTLDGKFDTVNKEVMSTNRRMKALIIELRSTRNVCFDIILVCVLLGIGAVIYNLLAGKA